MATDLVELLDHEKIAKVVSVGHDWGSNSAQRVYLWHPERVVGLLTLNVPYMPPSGPSDLPEALDMMEKHFGAPLLAYWELFTAPDGAEVIEAHLESMYDSLFGAPEDWMEQLFCRRGAYRAFLLNDGRQELRPFAKDPEFKERWLARFKRDGFKGPLNWYHAMKDNLNWDAEKDIPPERLVINVPVLHIGATQDAVCRMEMIYGPKQAGQLPDLVIEEVVSGHWQTYEVPEKTGPLMAKWLKEKDFK
jgi:soluble epoxide hydrolase/lipid-phosphate phosphatase